MSNYGEISVAEMRRLSDDFGKRQVTVFVNRIPRGDLFQLCHDALSKARAEIDLNRAVKVDTDDLPDELKRAADDWVAFSIKRHRTKTERGHTSSLSTVDRRIHEIVRFCRFLRDQGIERWPDVAQRHLDEYILLHHPRAGQKVFTFLKWLRRRTPMMQEFERALNDEETPARHRVLSASDLQAIVRRAMDDDPDVALVVLLVGAYAQTGTAAVNLDTSQLMRIDGRIKARFNVLWVQLDPMAERLIQQVAQNSGIQIPDEEISSAVARRIFLREPKNLLAKVGRVAGIGLRELRVTAINNFIRAGLTKRVELHQAFGVKPSATKYVEKSFPWDLHSTVSREVAEVRRRFLRGEDV